MDSSSISPVSSVKRRIRSGSNTARSGRTSSCDSALQELKAEALRCHTPKQFRELLERLRAFIPYKKFAGSWGYPSRMTIRFVFNHGVPLDVVRWYLETGSQWVNPIYQEWLRTNRAYLWCDAAKRLKVEEQFPELLERATKAGLQYGLVGGLVSPDY